MLKFFINKKSIIALVLTIIFASIAFWYFKRNTNVIKSPIRTEKPIKQDITQIVSSSGTLKAKDQITVGSLVAGRVIKILVDNNDFVKKDQVLAVLDNGVGDSAVKRSKATLQEAISNLNYLEKFYERQKALYKAAQISKNQFEQYTKDIETARARVDQIKAELEIQQKEYENLFIKSPDDGIVIAKEIDLGQMVTAQLQATVLFTIAKDLHLMEANVDVDESDVGIVKEGQEAIFTVDSFPKKKFKAKVRQIRYLAKIIDNVVTYATILDVENPNLELRPGMTTNVDIKTGEAKSALTVSNKALRINSNLLEEIAKTYDWEFERIPSTDAKTEIDNVWIFKDKKLKQIKVELGLKEGAFTQISSEDINENSQIVVELLEVKRDNQVLNQLFKQPGGLGK